MQVIPVRTPVLKNGDDIASVIAKEALRPSDILVISSKAVATMEGAAVRLADLTPSADATSWAEKTGKSAAFLQAVIGETARLNGRIVGTCPGAVLTELRPAGLTRGTLLVPNAGMDQSNVEAGYAVGWPHDPVKSVHNIRYAVQRKTTPIAVILTDSCCRPGRLGVTAFALACSGIDPFLSFVGKADAFGHPLRVTQEAVADQLATAANAVMGNADQLTPAAIIRDHWYQLSDFEGWVPGIEPREDLFKDVMQRKEIR